MNESAPWKQPDERLGCKSALLMLGGFAAVAALMAQPGDGRNGNILERAGYKCKPNGVELCLYWSLAIQAYESTLISNDSRFDQFMDLIHGWQSRRIDSTGTAGYAGVPERQFAIHAVPQRTRINGHRSYQCATAWC